MRFAVLNNNIVENIIVADSREDAEIVTRATCIEYTDENPAGVGYTYDPVRDAFIPPKPYESWLLNEDSCLWEAPVAYPADGKFYLWDEETLSWKEVVND